MGLGVLRHLYRVALLQVFQRYPVLAIVLPGAEQVATSRGLAPVPVGLPIFL